MANRLTVVTRAAPGLLALALVSGCGDGAPEPPAERSGAAAETTDGNFVDRYFERNFVFLSQADDSVFLVPWLMETAASPDTVLREARGWLARGGIWEMFYAESWGTPASRAPSRVLPHGSLRLLVREGDAVDALVFDEGPRGLEITLGSTQANWTGPRGEAIELVEGAAYLSDQRVDGLILDMARGWARGSRPGGDWALLTSGDSLQLVLAADTEHGGDAEPVYRAWALHFEEQLQWPEVRVDWLETQAFPPARRDVPVSWRISSADGRIEGRLEVRSAEIQAREGQGPLLPVLALFEVEGQISSEEGRFPVRGLLVHERR
jgi:hypothetical protein